MSQQPPYPHLAPPPGGDDAPTVALRPPPPPAPGPPPPPPGSGSGSGTDPVAVLSVVFAFVFSPVGIVLGIVGRRRTRRSGRPGRGLATTGLVLSVVFLVLAAAATVYVTVLAGSIVVTSPATPADEPAVSAPADPADPTGPVPTGPAGTATVGVADGDYGPEVPSDALAEQVGAQTGATDVICPGYLPAQVDASTICSATVDGQQGQLETRVTAVEGAEATVDITRVG